MDICIHRVKEIRVDLHMPENGNCIKLNVMSRAANGYWSDADLEYVYPDHMDEIVLYDLPAEITNALIELFGKSDTA